MGQFLLLLKIYNSCQILRASIASPIPINNTPQLPVPIYEKKKESRISNKKHHIVKNDYYTADRSKSESSHHAWQKHNHDRLPRKTITIANFYIWSWFVPFRFEYLNSAICDSIIFLYHRICGKTKQTKAFWKNEHFKNLCPRYDWCMYMNET